MSIKPAILLNLFAAVLLTLATAAAQNTVPDNPPNNMNNGQSQEITDPSLIYNAKSPGDWVGKSVTLSNVSVQDTNDTGNFWVGADSHHRILVVKPANNPTLGAMQLHKGDVVTVSGVIQPASRYEADQTTASKGSMHDAEKGAGVYLMANNIEVKSRNTK